MKDVINLKIGKKGRQRDITKINCDQIMLVTLGMVILIKLMVVFFKIFRITA